MITIDKTKIEILKNCIKKPTRFSNAVKAYISAKLKQTKVNHEPVFIDLEPTIICNLKCKMCHVPIWNRKHPNLTFRDFKNIIDQFPNLLLVKIQGMGEPLFNREIMDMVKYSRKKGIVVRTTSNATILNNKISKKLVKSGLNEILFSIDGATKETFEKIRVGANFEKVIENIKRFVDIRNKINGRGGFPRVIIWNVFTKENSNEIEGIIKITKDIGADELTLQMALNSYGNEELKKDYRDKYALKKNSATMKIINKAFAVAKKEGVKLRTFFGDIYSKKNICKNPWLTAYITVDKYVTPCCIRPDPRKFNLGNLKKKSFKDIWNSKKYIALRKAVARNTLPKMCLECYE